MQYKEFYLPFCKINIHVSGVNHAYHQEHKKMLLQPPILRTYLPPTWPSLIYRYTHNTVLYYWPNTPEMTHNKTNIHVSGVNHAYHQEHKKCYYSLRYCVPTSLQLGQVLYIDIHTIHFSTIDLTHRRWHTIRPIYMLEQVTLSFPYNDKCFGHKSTENPNTYWTGKKIIISE